MSPAQIEANRANAQLSTGPATAEGKERSSRNATRHGLNSTANIVTAEDQPAYDALVCSLKEEIGPEGALEEIAFDRLITARWQMIRVQRLQSDLLEKSGGADPLKHPDTKKDAELYMRYYVRYEGSYNRAMRELKDHQTARAITLIVRQPENALLPALANPTKCQQFAERSHRMANLKARTGFAEANRVLTQAKSTLLLHNNPEVAAAFAAGKR